MTKISLIFAKMAKSFACFSRNVKSIRIHLYYIQKFKLQKDYRRDMFSQGRLKTDIDTVFFCSISLYNHHSFNGFPIDGCWYKSAIMPTTVATYWSTPRLPRWRYFCINAESTKTISSIVFTSLLVPSLSKYKSLSPVVYQKKWPNIHITDNTKTSY